MSIDTRSRPSSTYGGRVHRARGILRSVGAILVLGVVVAVGTRVRRSHRAIQLVLPELRTPVLYAPMSLRDARSLRIGRRLLAAATTKPVPGIQIRERLLPAPDGHAVRALLYERPDRTRPSGAIVWIHGGGLVLGRPEQSNEFASRMADELDIVVVSVDYRLAPEHPFPAGLDDCGTALRWVHDRADDLGVDPDRIAVGGDSAGGGLAAALAQRARDEHGPPICFQALVYPMLDDRTVQRNGHGGRGEFVWTPTSNRFAWTAYLGHSPNADPLPDHAAPARCDDLSDLPPAWIGVGELDLFLEEDLDYAERLEAAGVRCQRRVERGTYHGADSMLPARPASREFRADLLDALRAALSPTGD